jgi:hypothetical protein
LISDTVITSSGAFDFDLAYVNENGGVPTNSTLKWDSSPILMNKYLLLYHQSNPFLDQ